MMSENREEVMIDRAWHLDPTLAVRDLVGYGDQPPAFEWPGGARLAVNFVVNIEEGAERNVLDGDLDREWLAEVKYVVPDGERELYLESTFEYGSRVGFWRVIDLFDRMEVTPTAFVCGQSLERNPDIAHALVERNCDVVGHGYRWLPPTGLAPDEEQEQIRLAAESIEKSTGKRIKGWFWRPSNTVLTRQALANEGLLYDSGAFNDDLPYFDNVAGRPFLVVPYALDVNDAKFHKSQFFIGEDFLRYAIDAFDLLYAESTEMPRMMTVGLHTRIIGRPSRIGALRQLLEHVLSHDKVWVAGRDEIASFWAQTFASDDMWNLERADSGDAGTGNQAERSLS
jgi:peptidoglycan/xylan/chitin deacetylase (PgdA/CDA1 family)